MTFKEQIKNGKTQGITFFKSTIKNFKLKIENLKANIELGK